MSESPNAERVEVTRRIAAPAPAIFAIVSSPQGHVDIDGSGMLEAAGGPSQLTEVGEAFEIDMDRTPLNDIPGLGKYHVTNHVTKIDFDRLFEWQPSGGGMPPIGYVWGWVLEPVSDTETDVTNYCDWSAVPEESRSSMPLVYPVVPVEMVERSVDNLERLVTGG